MAKSLCSVGDAEVTGLAIGSVREVQVNSPKPKVSQHTRKAGVTVKISIRSAINDTRIYGSKTLACLHPGKLDHRDWPPKKKLL